MEGPDVITFGMLVTDIRTKIQPLWSFHEVAQASLARLGKAKWHDPTLDRLEHKGRMKAVGGALVLQETMLKELVVLSLGKTMETVRRLVDKETESKVNLWRAEADEIPFVAEARALWATYNVVKHHDGIVPEEDNPNATHLIEHEGALPGDRVPGDGFDARWSIFALHEFLYDLAARSTRTPLASSGKSARYRFRHFARTIVPEVVQKSL